ncbi:MAG: magnesium transporter [Oscillospiraceae bacterium]|nr:magnesium transporter [Oscillospiraceae bacterium]
MNNHTELENLLEEKHFNLLRKGISEIEPADIAALIEKLSIEKAVLLFRILPKDSEAEVFANLEADTQETLIRRLSDKEISHVIEELFLDDAVDFIEEMPASVAQKVLSHATRETREQINRLLKYPEDSAGSIMTVEYVHLKRSMSVQDAFTKIRKIGPDKETIYTCYVTDPERRIEGVISVKTLLLSEPEQALGDIMDTNLILVHTDTDREEVARLFEKYDFLSLPVVDSERRIVGIITIDDIVDVVQEEATEDFEIMAAMTPSEKPYLKTSVFKLFKNRIGWLVLLMITGMGTGFILQGYEEAFLAVPLLVTFIPMLTDTGGNAGSQSATLIIRGMAVSEISPKDFLKIAWKEARISALAGVVLSIVAFLRVYLLNYGEPDLLAKSLVISLSLIFTVFMAKLAGSMLPILAKRLKIDPAVMAAPLITTIVDTSSLIVFFSIAKILLGHLM